MSYLVVIVLIAASLPLSKFAMSVTEFLLLALWFWADFSFRIAFRFFKLGGFFKGFYHLIGYLIRLMSVNFVDKMGLFFKNKAAVVLASIYLLHVIGMLHTVDLDYALKDLRIKLPLLLFPVVFSTMNKIKYPQFRIIILYYSAAILVGSLISFGLLLKGEYVDIRDISPFISSIRFGLNVSFAFFSLIYFIGADSYFKIWHKILFALVAVWFIVFLFLLESVTSLGIILVVTIGYAFYLTIRNRTLTFKLVSFAIAVSLPVIVLFYVSNVVQKATHAPVVHFENLDTHTAQGNAYVHDTINRHIEDGRYIGLYMSQGEMMRAWNKRSEVDYNGLTEGGQQIKETLIRYLTSKDLRKDGAGVEALSDWDVRMIEKGAANYNYLKYPGMRIRILKILMGYQVYKKTGDPSGSSVMQRIEYTKAALAIAADNFWIGVGTGDLEGALINQYVKMKSELKQQYRFHAHNQFLAILITFGIFGLLWFLFALLYPPFKTKAFGDYFFVVFFFIIMASMVSDDTLETQAGATLFAFFYSFLIFGKERENAPAKADSQS